MKIKFLSIAFIFLGFYVSPAIYGDGSDYVESSPQQWYSSITAYRVAISSPVYDLKLIRDAGSFEFISGRIDIIETVRGR